MTNEEILAAFRNLLEGTSVPWWDHSTNRMKVITKIHADVNTLRERAAEALQKLEYKMANEFKCIHGFTQVGLCPSGCHSQKR